MFLYTSDVSSLSHYIINNFIKEKNIAIDGTLGNGFDTDFLSNNFRKVFTFDIQKEPCDNYVSKNIDNVTVINDSHENFTNYINTEVDCIIYNLGFLPGGDKNITTISESSLNSIKSGLEILNNQGLMLIAIYRGHDEGEKEDTVISEYLTSLSKSKFAVMKHEVINRSSKSPILFVVEKK